jgi:hypothetical protein
MKDRYVSCYLSGRFDAFDGETDLDKLVELVWSGQPVRDVTLNAARTAIAHEADTATKLQWIKDNLEDIKTMGGDTEKSWRLYVQGRTDALAHQLEDEMMNIVEEDEGDEEEDDSDESDDDSDESADLDEEDEEEIEELAPEEDYVITDEKETPLLYSKSRTAAKRLALKLVREGKYRHLEVHHKFRGRLHMQGQATREGWSDV